MERKIFRKAFGVLSLLFILCVLTSGVFAKEVTVNAKSSMPPITILKDVTSNGNVKVGDDIRLYKDKSKYYAFLPVTCDRSSVLVSYNGDYKLYDEETGKTYSKGSEARINLSSDNACIYEYDESTGEYYRYNLIVMQSGAIGTMYITLDGGDDTLKKINTWHDYSATGSMKMTNPNGKVLYDGDMTKLKGHGLTSYEGSGKINTKNSYNINIADKADLIDGAGKSKKYTMLRIRTWGSYDYTGLSYITAFYTYNALVKESYYNICARFVDVYIDGEYRGIYVLTERMDINGSMEVTNLEKKTLYDSTEIKSVNKGDDPAIKAGIRSYSYCKSAYLDESEGEVDITGGYVLEIMCGTYGDCGFKTKKGMYVNIKSPAYCTKEQVQYIATYVQEFENALFSETGYNELGKHYTDYVDATSYAAQTIVYGFYCNWELYRTSTYMHKDVDGSQYGKITFGPVWDFESGPDVIKNDGTLLGSQFTYDVEQQYIWFEQAWQKGDYLYMVSEMADDMKGVLDQLLGKTDAMDIFSFNDMAAQIAPSQGMNWIRWQQNSTYDKCQKAMYDAIKARYKTWYDGFWNDANYLTGFVANCTDNGDGTYTLTATSYGKATGDITWYKMNSSWTGGTEVGTGKSITVKDPGMYYAKVKGTNNNYCPWAAGKVFKSKSLVVTSNVIDISSLPVVHLSAEMQGTSIYAKVKAEAENARQETENVIQNIDVAGDTEQNEALTTENTIITETDVEAVNTDESTSNVNIQTGMIAATVIVFLVSAVISALNLTDRRKNNA